MNITNTVLIICSVFPSVLTNIRSFCCTAQTDVLPLQHMDRQTIFPSDSSDCTFPVFLMQSGQTVVQRHPYNFTFCPSSLHPFASMPSLPLLQQHFLSFSFGALCCNRSMTLLLPSLHNHHLIKAALLGCCRHVPYMKPTPLLSLSLQWIKQQHKD